MTREELLNSLKNWERTLHVMIWSDHSSITNHGHIPLTANATCPRILLYITGAWRKGRRWWKNPKSTLQQDVGTQQKSSSWAATATWMTSNSSPLKALHLTMSLSRTSVEYFMVIIHRKTSRVAIKLEEILGAMVVLQHQHSILTMHRPTNYTERMKKKHNCWCSWTRKEEWRCKSLPGYEQKWVRECKRRNLPHLLAYEQKWVN